MQQRPFLSRYEFNLQNSEIITDLTVVTKTMESSDDDEYHLNGTWLTEATEGSDDDEYITDSTSRRKSIGDEDECFSFGTVMTRTIEDSDTDLFMFEEIR